MLDAQEQEKLDYIRTSRINKISDMARMEREDAGKEDGYRMECWEQRYHSDVPFLLGLVDKLLPIEAAMREWFDANQAHDEKRWLAACRKMDTLMGGTWEATEPPLDEIDFTCDCCGKEPCVCAGPVTVAEAYGGHDGGGPA